MVPHVKINGIKALPIASRPLENNNYYLKRSFAYEVGRSFYMIVTCLIFAGVIPDKWFCTMGSVVYAYRCNGEFWNWRRR